MKHEVLDLVDVARFLFEKGLSIEKLAELSGLSEKDVRAVVKKGTQLIRREREEAVKKLKPIWQKTQGDCQLITK